MNPLLLPTDDTDKQIIEVIWITYLLITQKSEYSLILVRQKSTKKREFMDIFREICPVSQMFSVKAQWLARRLTTGEVRVQIQAREIIYYFLPKKVI